MPRIAVVDDDDAFLRYMTDALSDRGWEVLTCADGFAAYDFLLDTLPDVAMIDIRIGGDYTGWDVCSYLQLHPRTAHVPIIVCSAASDVLRDRAAFVREHDLAVLEKPFELDDLYRVVETALARVPSVIKRAV